MGTCNKILNSQGMAMPRTCTVCGLGPCTHGTETHHQGLPVAGYRAQSDEKVQMVNVFKALEERVLRQVDHIRGHGAVDQRMLALGVTNLQQAFMWLNRAIFQPGRVTLPEDDQG